MRGPEVVLDEAGRFLVDGAPVTHPGVEAALRAALDRDPAGRYVLRNAVGWAPLVVRGAPLHARRAEVEGDGPGARVVLVLEGGERAPLDPATLTEGADGALHARARDGTWPVRLGPQAVLDLAPWLAARAEGATDASPPPPPPPAA